MIVEKRKVELKNPVLIEGLPGLGLVGKIATEYLIKQLGAEKIAELYSPHFAYYIIVDQKGEVRLLRLSFYYWRNEKGENDFILLTGDSQAQTIQGQYEVAGEILDFIIKKCVKLIITIGGYRKEVEGTPQVFASATSPNLLKKALKAGAKESPPGNPIVGTAGLLLGLAKFRDLDALCLLAETPGYLPDQRAAKSVINVIMKMLNFTVDLSGLEKEIHKSMQIEERMKKLEEQMRNSAKIRKKVEEEKISYIS